MKYVSTILVCFAILVITSCNNKNFFNEPDSLTETIANRKTVFNPDYFRDSSGYHFILNVSYENGNYVLHDKHVYKVPGTFRDTSNSGTLAITFFDNSGVPLHKFLTTAPNKFIKEKDSAYLTLDSIVFALPVKPNAKLYSVQFSESNTIKGSFNIPTDTIDRIEQNKMAPLDSSLF